MSGARVDCLQFHPMPSCPGNPGLLIAPGISVVMGLPPTPAGSGSPHSTARSETAQVTVQCSRMEIFIPNLYN